MSAPLVIAQPSALDPCLPLESSGVYSHSDGKSKWMEVSPQGLADMLEGGSRPAFRTALARYSDSKDEARYAGPLYFDFDGDLEEVLFVVQQEFVPNLRKRGVNPHACRWFLTGGRGIHVEVPQACFTAEPGFVLNLPAIYKEMARELFVDTLDLRVYSGGKGRMWRVPNIERLKDGKPTGAFKAPIDFDSLMSCTPESYAEYCSTPRPFPKLEAPTLAQGLADLFNKYCVTVTTTGARRNAWTGAEDELFKRWSGNAPPGMAKVLQGGVPLNHDPDLGWNKIAIQIAYMALALQWDVARMRDECDGMIQNHAGDGSRYNTPKKRADELERLWHYYEAGTRGTFTVPGLLSILPPGVRGAVRSDLAGIVADAPEDQRTIEEILAECSTMAEFIAAGAALADDDTRHDAEIDAFIKKAAKAAGCSESAMRKSCYRKQAVDSGKRIIDVRKGDLAGMVDGVAALLPEIKTLRQRGGLLVEIHGMQFRTVDHDRLARLISDIAVWMYPNGPGKADKDVLNSLRQEPHWPVPEVLGIAVQPTITDSGEIGAPEGFHVAYDAAKWSAFHGLPDDLVAEIRAIHEAIYAEDDRDAMLEGLKAAIDNMPRWMGANLGEPRTVALGNLRGLLSGFPFKTPVDESAALAAILTAVVRPTLRTAPAFLIVAHEIGTGKTFLADLISMFATPDALSRTWPARDEEQKKDLLSALVSGSPVLWYDNLMRPWCGEAIAKALTLPTYTGRVLNETRDATVSTRVLCIATGNNIAAVKDMARRTLTVNLDAAVENPSTRKFNRDPVAEVRANREEWVMTALAFLQGFILSGRKPDMTPYGSFGDWSDLVRAALVDAGLPDPVQAVMQNIESDPEREAMGIIMTLWLEEYGDTPVAVRDIVSNHSPNHLRFGTGLGHLLVEVAGERGSVDTAKLGRWLTANRGRVVEGFRFASAGRSRKGQMWKIEAI